MDLALQALLGSVCLVGGDHLDEAKTTRLLSVRIAHDVTLLYLAVLLEETGDLFFAKSRMNSSDEEVGARVTALIVIIPTLWRRATE